MPTRRGPEWRGCGLDHGLLGCSTWRPRARPGQATRTAARTCEIQAALPDSQIHKRTAADLLIPHRALDPQVQLQRRREVVQERIPHDLLRLAFRDRNDDAPGPVESSTSRPDDHGLIVVNRPGFPDEVQAWPDSRPSISPISSPDINHCSTSSPTDSALRRLGPLSAHSQTTKVRHPRRLRASMLPASRKTLDSSLLRHFPLLEDGHLNSRHKCRCQKHPCTRITALYLGKTISGLPGNPPK